MGVLPFARVDCEDAKDAVPKADGPEINPISEAGDFWGSAGGSAEDDDGGHQTEMVAVFRRDEDPRFKNGPTDFCR